MARKDTQVQTLLQKIILEVTQNVMKYCRKQMSKDLALETATFLICAQFTASPFQQEGLS